VAAQFFSGSICFEFSILVLWSERQSCAFGTSSPRGGRQTTAQNSAPLLVSGGPLHPLGFLSASSPVTIWASGGSSMPLPVEEAFRVFHPKRPLTSHQHRLMNVLRLVTKQYVVDLNGAVSRELHRKDWPVWEKNWWSLNYPQDHRLLSFTYAEVNTSLTVKAGRNPRKFDNSTIYLHIDFCRKSVINTQQILLRSVPVALTFCSWLDKSNHRHRIWEESILFYVLTLYLN